MKTNDSNKRRQFLKNASLAAFTLAIGPGLAKSEVLSITKAPAGGCNPCTLDYYGEGPFYTPGAPSLVGNQLAGPSEPGTRLIISGSVLNLSCNELIPNTVIDIWHADDSGAYDNVGFNLRGKTTSNASGYYLFESIYPGKYLNGASYRPSHIHFKITPPGFSTLTTQLYFQGDTDIPGDAAASITSGTYNATARIIPVTLNGSGVYEGTWDIVINGSGVPIGVEELHLTKGMIYSASPNPFSDRVEINYGIFNEAVTRIVVYDMQGKQVAELEEQTLGAEKYTAVWDPKADLPDGHYFITLKINDQQVHYVKVVKQS